MQLTIFIVTLGLLAVSVNSHEEQPKVCLKTTDDCKETATSAKQMIHELREIKFSDPSNDIKIYLNKLQDLFNLTTASGCRLDFCKCEDSVLLCAPLANKLVRLVPNLTPTQHDKLPKCLSESEKAKEVAAKLRMALSNQDRAGFIDTLAKTFAKITQALTERTDAENEKLVNCIKETILGLRQVVKEKITKLNPQPNCDFCSNGDVAPTNMLPVPLLLHNHNAAPTAP